MKELTNFLLTHLGPCFLFVTSPLLPPGLRLEGLRGPLRSQVLGGWPSKAPAPRPSGAGKTRRVPQPARPLLPGPPLLLLEEPKDSCSKSGAGLFLALVGGRECLPPVKRYMGSAPGRRELRSSKPRRWGPAPRPRACLPPRLRRPRAHLGRWLFPGRLCRGPRWARAGQRLH